MRAQLLNWFHDVLACLDDEIDESESGADEAPADEVAAPAEAAAAADAEPAAGYLAWMFARHRSSGTPVASRTSQRAVSVAASSSSKPSMRLRSLYLEAEQAGPPPLSSPGPDTPRPWPAARAASPPPAVVLARDLPAPSWP